MKKIYKTPGVKILEMLTDGILCQASGQYDSGSISKEEEEDLNVKGNSFKNNPVQWEDWQ